MILIDMPMPENCSECRFETESGYCKAMHDNFCGYTDEIERPKWCPLKKREYGWISVKERMPERQSVMLAIVDEVLHSGLSIDTESDQDYVCKVIRERIEEELF